MRQSNKYFVVLSLLLSILSTSCGLFKTRTTDNNSANKGGGKFDNRAIHDIISTARDYTGTPYKFGGITRNGMDCSGLVTVAFNSVNLKLPRVSADMATVGKEIKMKDVRPGDLLFFITGKEDKISHVGIVTEVRGKDNVLFIHAADAGVKEDNLYQKYYQKTFTKATRPF